MHHVGFNWAHIDGALVILGFLATFTVLGLGIFGFVAMIWTFIEHRLDQARARRRGNAYVEPERFVEIYLDRSPKAFWVLVYTCSLLLLGKLLLYILKYFFWV